MLCGVHWVRLVQPQLVCLLLFGSVLVPNVTLPQIFFHQTMVDCMLANSKQPHVLHNQRITSLVSLIVAAPVALTAVEEENVTLPTSNTTSKQLNAEVYNEN